ncbi:MAG: lipoate--protein ligase family protein [Planctomycetes bacterium]|nr:lipoate--protein ligase family protein [Planctomycetota bacterium]
MMLDGAADASWNMAVDEALLTAGDRATLRFYGWSPHAVSLGWFQRWTDFADVPADVAVVRRLTGGGAIHHGDEVTFSLTCDAAVLPGDIAASYRLLHDAAVAAMRRLGVPCSRLDAGAHQQARPDQRWCFAVPGRDDVVTARGKLLGSAQRRTRAPRPRILHHGSIVLRRPALTPFTAALADAIDDDPATVERLRAALTTGIADALDLIPAPGTLSPAEHALATHLQATRYRDPAFVRRR